MSLDQQVDLARQALSRLPVETGDPATLVAHARRTRNKIRVAVVVLSGVACLAVGAVLVALANDNGAPSISASPATGGIASDAPSLLMSDRTVSENGQLIALAVVNPTDQSFDTGLGVIVDRRVGDAWEEVYTLPTVRYEATVASSRTDPATPLIQMLRTGVEPHDSSSLEMVTLPPLATGPYRLRKGTASVSFEVVSSQSGDDAPPVDSSRLVLVPVRPVLPSRAALDFYVVERGLNLRLGEPYTSPAVSRQGRLDRWSNGQWEFQGDVTIVRSSNDPTMVSVALPGLEEGAYRIVGTSAGSDVTGPFWIVATL